MEIMKLFKNVSTHEELFDARDPEGRTALHLATIKGHANIVRLLLKHNLPVDVPIIDRSCQSGKEGWTALHCAVDGGHYEVVTALLGHQASLQATDLNVNTPLHLAAAQQRDSTFDIVNALLTQGAPTTKRNIQNQAPLDVAIECGNELIIDLLLNWQSRPTEPARGEEQEATCCICLERFQPQENLVAGNALDPSQPCGHRLHEACSGGLYRCPLCNKDLHRQTPWMKLY